MISKSHTFQNAATAAGKGQEFPVGGMTSLLVEIYGSATSATVEFKAKSFSGTERPLVGIKVPDMSTGTSGGMNEVYQFDVTGWETIIADLTAVTGGDVTVKGKAVG